MFIYANNTTQTMFIELRRVNIRCFLENYKMSEATQSGYFE